MTHFGIQCYIYLVISKRIQFQTLYLVRHVILNIQYAIVKKEILNCFFMEKQNDLHTQVNLTPLFSTKEGQYLVTFIT